MRFRRRGFSRKGGREPTIWTRTKLTIGPGASMAGTNVAATIADPATLPGVGSTTDQRWTMMRGLFQLNLIMQSTVPAGSLVGDTTIAYLGIFMGSSGESPNPETPTQNIDWLWFDQARLVAVAAGAGTVTIVPTATRNLQNQSGLLDLKTKRKLDADEVLRLIIRGDVTDVVSGHNATAMTVSGTIMCSVLWKRTMR